MDKNKFQQLLKKVEEAKKSGNFDLSTDEDLSIAVMNLISLEEHFFFTAEKTGKEEYIKMLDQVREMRKSLLSQMIKTHEGETWCISKHLLGTTMRLIEVGTKLQTAKKGKEAQEMFDNAYKIYSLFWALRLKLLELKDVKATVGDEPWGYQDLVSKLVDCCKE
ncbi:MAG: hypothetical protein HYU80_04070 [Candidatus Blackburnbacteria bacterium]|nr:hypothetical protein [Candidatus Blackburnbacteria bacterium]